MCPEYEISLRGGDKLLNTEGKKPLPLQENKSRAEGISAEQVKLVSAGQGLATQTSACIPTVLLFV